MSDEINIPDIRIGSRHRNDMGDLEELAWNIAVEGLLHPIGVTADNELVFGMRRLLACRDILGWSTIPARIVNVTSMVAGEYAENEMRKDFTHSERLAIRDTIAQTIESQQGQRTDLNFRPDRVGSDCTEPVQVANKRVGYTKETARRVKVVLDSGTPELIEAMDRGAIKVEPASVLAVKPAEEQRRVLALPAPKRKEAVKAERSKSKRRKPVERPYVAFTGTREDTGRPPPDASYEEKAAWRDKVGGKVILHPPRLKTLLNDRALVNNICGHITRLIRNDAPTVDEFKICINRMLDHVHNQNPDEPADKINFAKEARDARKLIKKNIRTALRKLQEYDDEFEGLEPEVDEKTKPDKSLH